MWWKQHEELCLTVLLFPCKNTIILQWWQREQRKITRLPLHRPDWFCSKTSPHGCTIIPSSPRGSHCAAIHAGSLIKQNFRGSLWWGTGVGWVVHIPGSAPCSIKARIQMGTLGHEVLTLRSSPRCTAMFNLGKTDRRNRMKLKCRLFSFMLLNYHSKWKLKRDF